MFLSGWFDPDLRPRRLPGTTVILIVAFWLTPLVVVTIVRSYDQQAFRGRIHPLEFLSFLAILLLVFAAPRIRQTFARIGIVRQCVMATLVAGMLIAQLIGQSGVTYPFQPWNMFTRRISDSGFAEYEVEMGSGEVRGLPMHRIFPAGYRAMISQVEGRSVEYGRQQPQLWNFEASLRHLVAVHNRRHPDDPIHRIRVYVCRYDMRDWTGLESLDRQLVLDLTIEAQP